MRKRGYILLSSLSLLLTASGCMMSVSAAYNYSFYEQLVGLVTYEIGDPVQVTALTDNPNVNSVTVEWYAPDGSLAFTDNIFSHTSSVHLPLQQKKPRLQVELGGSTLTSILPQEPPCIMRLRMLP